MAASRFATYTINNNHKNMTKNSFILFHDLSWVASKSGLFRNWIMSMIVFIVLFFIIYCTSDVSIAKISAWKKSWELILVFNKVTSTNSTVSRFPCKLKFFSVFCVNIRFYSNNAIWIANIVVKIDELVLFLRRVQVYQEEFFVSFVLCFFFMKGGF